MESEDLLASRILFDSRQLKKCIKRWAFFTGGLSSSKTSSAPSPPLGDVNSKNDVEGTGTSAATVAEERQMAFDHFLLELSSLESSLLKYPALRTVHARELAHYTSEADRLRRNIQDAKQELDSLRAGLVQAKLLRERKAEYDVWAGKLNKLAPQSKLKRDIQAVKLDMERLKAEQDAQEEALAVRKRHVGALMTALYDAKISVLESKQKEQMMLKDKLASLSSLSASGGVVEAEDDLYTEVDREALPAMAEDEAEEGQVDGDDQSIANDGPEDTSMNLDRAEPAFQ